MIVIEIAKVTGIRHSRLDGVQDHDRHAATSGPHRVVPAGWIDRAVQRPEPFTLLALGLVRLHLPSPAPDDDVHLG